MEWSGDGSMYRSTPHLVDEPVFDDGEAELLVQLVQPFTVTATQATTTTAAAGVSQRHAIGSGAVVAGVRRGER